MTTCLLCWRSVCVFSAPGDCDAEAMEMDTCQDSEDNKESPLGIREGLKLFVVLEVLNISREWCQRRKLLVDEALKLVQICDDCLTTGVYKAWKINNQINLLTEELKSIKADLKDVMRERMTRKQKGGQRGQGGKRLDDVYEEIFKQIGSNLLPCVMPLDIPQSGFSVEPEPMSKPAETSSLNEDQQVPSPVGEDETYDNMSAPEEDKNDSYLSEDANSHSESEEPQKCKRTPKIVLKCSRCPSRLASSEALVVHMNLHESNDALGESSFTCSQCQFPCQTSLELDTHKHYRHVIPSRHVTRSCPLCSFKTKIWSHLKRHAETEHSLATPEQLGPEILLKCLECSLQFSSIRQYEYHHRSVHNTIASPATLVQCPTCGVIFENSEKLHLHNLNVHERDCKFVCEECGVGFRRQIHLDSHKITHNKSKRELICEICGIDYLHEFSLDDHIKKYHSNNSPQATTSKETHKCRYCDLTSPFRVVILRHLKTHKEENGHKCQLCGKIYMNSNRLKRHLIINHPQGDGKHKCPFCFKEYASMNAVQGHVKYHCAIKKLQEQQLKKQPS